MISPKLYRSSRTYDFFLKFLGYENSIDRFLQGLHLDLGPHCRVLDAGCGTGLLGLHFMERFPQASLLATDLEPNFLQATLANADRRGVDRSRISVQVGDISQPMRIKSLDGSVGMLQAASFDLVCVGAVIGYAKDQEESLRQLIRLVAPGGYFINMEMNEGVMGRFVAHRYHYHNIPLHRMLDTIRGEGCEATATQLPMNYFPAKLTRTAVIARKHSN